MYRDQTFLVFHPRVNFSCQHAAVGDTITTLPAIIEARRRNPYTELHVWVGDYLLELVTLLLKPYGEFIVVPGSMVIDAQQRGTDGKTRVHKAHKDARKIGMDSSGPVVMNAVPYDVHTRTKTDMVAFGFHAILDTEPESLEAMSYPTAAPLGPRTIDRPYVAIQAGYTVKNRAFPATAMQPVLEWILAQGMLPVILGKTLNKMPVIVGAKNNTMETVTQSDFDAVAEVVRHQCLDLRDQTTLVQARDVLGHAEAVVGVDGGLLHVAATTNTPIVYGLTNTTERCRTPVRHGLPGWRWRPVMVKGLACQGCQSNWTLVYGHDFRTCYYQDYACVTQLDGQDFINALRGLLDERAQHAAAEGTPPGSTGEQGA